jgi:anti-sigma regulatory factor (Ser/Thr protein kinase)
MTLHAVPRRAADPAKRLDVRASLEIVPDATSAKLARGFISDFCSAADLGEEVCQLASLLTSELVTNAVRYGGSRAVLEAHLPGGSLRVSVADENPALPVVGTAPDLTAESGRGVLLVSNLASRWGVEQLDAGKAVWFELDLADR